MSARNRPATDRHVYANQRGSVSEAATQAGLCLHLQVQAGAQSA